MGELSTSRKKALIVEDEPLVAESFRRGLSKYCDIEIAPTFSAARKAIHAAQWAVFLVDVGLPDGSGLDLLGDIRKSFPYEPIVLMTGGDASSPSRAALIHSAMFVSKPLPTEWVATFRRWVEPKREDLDLWERFESIGLSERESEVFAELATGASAKIVADRFGITASTVRAHCNNVYRRLGVNTFTQVYSMALRSSRRPPHATTH